MPTFKRMPLSFPQRATNKRKLAHYSQQKEHVLSFSSLACLVIFQQMLQTVYLVTWSVCSNVRGCHTSISSDQRLSRLLVLHQWHSGYQLSCWRWQEEEGRRWEKEYVRVFICVTVFFWVVIFQVHIYKYTAHINTLYDDGQPQDHLLTLPAWKAQMEKKNSAQEDQWQMCVSVCIWDF